MALAAMVVGAVPTAVAYAGGTPAPSQTGGSEYGAALASAHPARPIASIFTVNPKVVVAPRLPRLRVRVDQPGAQTVRARLVFRPRPGAGAIVKVDAGTIPTGRRIAVNWPAGSQLPPGSYRAQLIVRGLGDRVLARTARARGMTTVTVRAPAPPPAPAAPAAPAPGAGVFPVAGPHTYGDGIGAVRNGHTHQGQDILAAEGTPVVSPLAGTVLHVDNQPSAAGWYIVVHTVDGRDMFFAHCQEGSIPVTIAPGAAVGAGQPICLVGHTGDATGPHLHFEIWVGGWRVSAASHFIDPLPDLQAWDPTV